MKQLNKRYKRNFTSNISFYISIAILTAIAIICYLGISAGYDAERVYMDKINADGKVEDSQFITYADITDEDIADLEEEFDIDLEKELYCDVEGVNNDAEDTVRFLRPMEKMNLYTVSEGEDVSSDTDILLSPMYAQSQNINIGDTVTIGGKKYTLTGYCIRPDYLFCLETLSSVFSESETFGIGIITRNAFDEIDEKDCSYVYSIVYHKDNEKEVRQAIYDRYQTIQYISAGVNNRIATPEDEMDAIESETKGILPGMMICIMILTAVVLGRKIKNEQKMIGILHALGYRKREIALHYSLFGAIPGILGSVIGILATIPLSGPILSMLYENKIEPFPIAAKFSLVNILIALFVPAVCYVIAVYLSAMSAMRGDIVNMIKGLSRAKGKTKLRLKNSKLSVRTKFRLRAIFGSIPRTCIVVFGIGIGSMLLTFCYACVDSLNVYIDDTIDSIGDFEYEYYLSSVQTDEPEYGEGIVCATFEVDGYADLLTINGTSSDNPYMNYVDTDGNAITIEKGKYYISDMASYVYGVDSGDEITFYDTASLKEYTVTIENVIKNASQSLIVSDRDTITDLIGLPQGSYNLVMSDKELDYNTSDIIRTIVKSDYKDQIRENVLVSMEAFTGLCGVLGIIICVIVIYLMTNILLMENATSISMMKVLGFYENEINGMVTHIYNYLIPIGTILGLVLGYYLNMLNFIANTAVYNTYIEAHMTVISAVKDIVIISVSYVISMLLLKKKTGSVSMVESLKNNRE
jgi:putative ABC transport system permease protein